MKANPTAVLILTLAVAKVLAAADPPQDPLQPFAWLEGTWELRGEKSLVEERWLPRAGRLMLGVSRTVARGDTVAFEFLRLEARKDGVFYVAQPGGKPPVAFRWNGASASEPAFENPEHDFPKRIVYRKNDDGSVTARVEGATTTGEKPQEFRFTRRKGDS